MFPLPRVVCNPLLQQIIRSLAIFIRRSRTVGIPVNYSVYYTTERNARWWRALGSLRCFRMGDPA